VPVLQTCAKFAVLVDELAVVGDEFAFRHDMHISASERQKTSITLRQSEMLPRMAAILLQ
jgi:hypothetical protein